MSEGPRITVITAVRNRVATVGACIESVLGQTWPDLEYLVIDGASTDGTDAVIDRYAGRISRVVREPDEGIYDALNKGIRLATGDVVGFLHADDLFADRWTLEAIARRFEATGSAAVYGDLVYVAESDPGRVIRYWRSGTMRPDSFRWGWMPPHPTFYLRREHYLEFGGFREGYSISADYESMLRMLVRHGLAAAYLPQVVVRMRVGGKSNASLGNRLQANREDRAAWLDNGLRPPWGLRLMKPLRKLPQFFRRPPDSDGTRGQAGRSGDSAGEPVQSG